MGGGTKLLRSGASSTPATSTPAPAADGALKDESMIVQQDVAWREFKQQLKSTKFTTSAGARRQILLLEAQRKQQEERKRGIRSPSPPLPRPHPPPTQPSSTIISSWLSGGTTTTSANNNNNNNNSSSIGGSSTGTTPADLVSSITKRFQTQTNNPSGPTSSHSNPTRALSPLSLSRESSFSNPKTTLSSPATSQTMWDLVYANTISSNTNPMLASSDHSRGASSWTKWDLISSSGTSNNNNNNNNNSSSTNNNNQNRRGSGIIDFTNTRSIDLRDLDDTNLQALAMPPSTSLFSGSKPPMVKRAHTHTGTAAAAAGAAAAPNSTQPTSASRSSNRPKDPQFTGSIPSATTSTWRKTIEYLPSLSIMGDDSSGINNNGGGSKTGANDDDEEEDEFMYYLKTQESEQERNEYDRNAELREELKKIGFGNHIKNTNEAEQQKQQTTKNVGKPAKKAVVTVAAAGPVTGPENAADASSTSEPVRGFPALHELNLSSHNPVDSKAASRLGKAVRMIRKSNVYGLSHTLHAEKPKHLRANTQEDAHVRSAISQLALQRIQDKQKERRHRRRRSRSNTSRRSNASTVTSSNSPRKSGFVEDLSTAMTRSSRYSSRSLRRMSTSTSTESGSQSAESGEGDEMPQLMPERQPRGRRMTPRLPPSHSATAAENTNKTSNSPESQSSNQSGKDSGNTSSSNNYNNNDTQDLFRVGEFKLSFFSQNSEPIHTIHSHEVLQLDLNDGGELLEGFRSASRDGSLVDSEDSAADVDDEQDGEEDQDGDTDDDIGDSVCTFATGGLLEDFSRNSCRYDDDDDVEGNIETTRTTSSKQGSEFDRGRTRSEALDDDANIQSLDTLKEIEFECESDDEIKVFANQEGLLEDFGHCNRYDNNEGKQEHEDDEELAAMRSKRESRKNMKRNDDVRRLSSSSFFRLPILNVPILNSRGSFTSNVSETTMPAELLQTSDPNGPAPMLGKGTVDELFPPAVEHEGDASAGYIDGLAFLAPHRGSSIRKILNQQSSLTTENSFSGDSNGVRNKEKA